MESENLNVTGNVTTAADDAEAWQLRLWHWRSMTHQLKELKEKEMALRQQLFGAYFPTPVEGTNSYDLSEGWQLKAKYAFNRTVDPAAFTAMRPQFVAMGLSPDALIEWKPSLKISKYRELTVEERNFLDQCLIIKPASPAMEIVLPKRSAK